MKIAVLKETAAGERRVAIIPDSVKRLVKKGFTIVVESGAGNESGYSDMDYEQAGAEVSSLSKLCEEAEAFVKVQPPSMEEIGRLRSGAILVSILQAMSRHDLVKALSAQGVTAFGLDAVPRITLAQSMDVLSSMSTIAGYKAVLLAADSSNKFFPMLMTAAGTIAPARVLILGAGVAGLMACATAKRLGAIVEASDVRPVVKEQVQSVGAKFLEVESTESGEGRGGYAKEMSEDYKKRQAEMIAQHIARADVVIPTALIPGRKAPILITETMVKSMKPGSVIVDLAAEMGGNCELTEPDRQVVKHGVLIIGHTNLPSSLSFHASQMFSKNIEKYLLHLTEDGAFKLDMSDEITKGSLITHKGEVVHEQTAGLLAGSGGN